MTTEVRDRKRREDAVRRSVRHGCLLAGVVSLANAIAPAAGAQQPEPVLVTKPFLIVEGRFDRDATDLYAFEMDGTLIRRLTSEPLPSSHLLAVAPGRGDPLIESNASAFYNLSLRQNILTPIHSGVVRVAAVSPDGSTVAFVTQADTQLGVEVPPATRGRTIADPAPVLRVSPLVAGSPWRKAMFALAAEGVPTEMTFTPDGEHVLITRWPRVDLSQLLLVDLKTGATQPILASDTVSYYAPVFAPDGQSLLAVREDLDAGQWSIVSLPWPAADAPTVVVDAPTVVVDAPTGVSLSTPIFLADGERFLFHQGEAIARATLDGETVEVLLGELDQTPRAWRPGERWRLDRRVPARPSAMPRVVDRYLARVEWREAETPSDTPSADLIVIDVETKQWTTIPLPLLGVRAAVVVE